MHVRSLLVFAREGFAVDELVRGFEHILEVERVPWRRPISSVLCNRLAGRAAARLLAARAWVKAADRAPALRDTTDQVALFTSPDQVELADAIRAPRFYHATARIEVADERGIATQRRVAEERLVATQRRRVAAERHVAAERRLVAGCARVFADSPHLADVLRDRHGLAAERVVVLEQCAPVERARTMLAAMREVA